MDQAVFWIVLGVVFKLPIVAAILLCWYAIKDPPDQVLGEGGGGHGAPYDQGPRTRGPRPGLPVFTLSRRRPEHVHDAPPVPAVAVAGRSRDHDDRAE